MPRVGLNAAAVVNLAIEIVDEQGPDAVTLAAVAGRAGVATPSLYKHVGSLGELRTLIAARAMIELTDRIADAVIGRSGDDAVRSLLQAYRAYVVAYPGRYRTVPAQPLGDPLLEPVGERLLDIILAVLRGFGLTGSAAIHAARCIRSAAHGFAVLEAAGGFGLPEDLDATYEHLTTMLVAGIRSLERQ